MTVESKLHFYSFTPLLILSLTITNLLLFPAFQLLLSILGFKILQISSLSAHHLIHASLAGGFITSSISLLILAFTLLWVFIYTSVNKIRYGQIVLASLIVNLLVGIASGPIGVRVLTDYGAEMNLSIIIALKCWSVGAGVLGVPLTMVTLVIEWRMWRTEALKESELEMGEARVYDIEEIGQE